MATLLFIDTATPICSVALWKSDGQPDHIEINEEKAHARKLTVLIQSLMQRNNVAINNLDAVVVSKGPGSYTGLRIGVSVAKGLCYGAELPLIGISTLDAIAHGALEYIKNNNASSPPWICPMIDARRMEVYTALYSPDMKQTMAPQAIIIDNDAFADVLEQGQVLFLGSGVGKCTPVISHPNALFLDTYNHSALYLIQPARKRFKDKSFEDLAYFEPFYLKDFIATTPKRKVL
jgi:tRNA threonylcarbamoyladenosine biosynthesis protein TsaB